MHATAETLQDEDDLELTLKVQASQIQQLYKQTRGGLVGVAVITLLICVDLWDVLPHFRVSLWGVTSLVVIAARAVLTAQFRRMRPSGQEMSRWGQRHVIGACSSAALWAAAPIFLWPAHSPPHQLIWPVCIVAVSASAVAMYCTWTPSYLSYLLVSVIPISVRLLLGHGTSSVILGILGLFFIAILTQTGRSMNAATRQALVLALRNEGLCRRLSEEKAKGAALYEAIPAPIFVKDAAGRYSGCNRSFEEFVACTRQEMVGKTVQELWPAPLAERYHQMDLELMARGGIQSYEWQAKRADGNLRDVIFNKAVYCGSDGSPHGLVGVILDITDHKKAEEDARRRTEENSRLEAQMHHARTVTALMTQLSHDLNTPLTPLLALLPMVRGKVGAPMLERMLDVCLQSATTIEKLTAKSLDLLRLSSESELPPLVSVDLAASAERAIDQTMEEFANRRVCCENRIDRNTNVWGAGDQLVLLFKHLLGNAARYAAENGTVSIDAATVEEFVQVSVRDDGIGLDSGQAQLIFREFYKADPARRDVTTHGLGLAICQRIVLIHGGMIWAESPGIGKGTTIVFTLRRNVEV